MTADFRQRNSQCPTCRMRWRFPQAAVRALYGPLYIDRKAYHWLENAARVFDEQSEELFTAAEFVAWVRADIFGEKASMVEFDGAPPRNDTGNLTKRNDRSAHRHPFTLPQTTR
jgi:hypothetical protein